MSIWDVPLPFLSSVPPLFSAVCSLMCFRSHPLASSELPAPPRGIWASQPWHTSALSSATAPALALPAWDAHRSLRPVELSLYVHCLASGHCYPDTCRALDFSSLFPAPPQHPFLLISVYSVHTLLHPHTSPRSPRCCQLWVWCFPVVPLAGSPEHRWCLGVKGSWKELCLRQPAVAACPDHTASTLWLNSPGSTSFLLAQRKCGIVFMAARGECFPDKMKQKNMGGINIRKIFHGSAPTFSSSFSMCLSQGQASPRILIFLCCHEGTPWCNCWEWGQVVSVGDVSCFKPPLQLLWGQINGNKVHFSWAHL